MDYTKDFTTILQEAMQGLENDIYNSMFAQMAGGADDDVNKAAMGFFRALNRRGVSSRVIFEALKDAMKDERRNDNEG